MSDFSEGEGWWQASDGKWYAPELHPDYVAPAAPAAPPADVTAPVPPLDPTVATPAAGPPVDPTAAFPVGPPPGQPPITTAGPPVGPLPGSGGGRGKLIAAIIVVVALLGGGLAYALTRDDGKKSTTSTASTLSDLSSDLTDSSDSTDSDTDSSSSSSSSGSTSTAALVAKAKKSLLAAGDIGSGFSATDASSSGTLPCNEENPDDTVKPAGIAGTELDHGSDITIVEHIRVYDSATKAKQVFSAAKDGFDCSTSQDGSVTFSGSPTAEHLKGADDDFSVTGSFTDASAAGGSLHQNGAIAGASTDSLSDNPTISDSSSSGSIFAQFFVVRVGQSILTFTFVATDSADTSSLDQPSDITTKGISKFTK